MKRNFLRIAALVLSATIGFASLTAAAAAVELTPNTEQRPQSQAKTTSLSSIKNEAPTDGNNQTGGAVASLIAKQQAEEAVRKAAEEEAARLAAEAEAAEAKKNGGGYAAASNGGGDAWAILAGFGVEGVSLSYGDTYGYEAIAYYKSGHIVINPNHTTSLYTLIAHEVDHIIAWRQSGQTTE